MFDSQEQEEPLRCREGHSGTLIITKSEVAEVS